MYYVCIMYVIVFDKQHVEATQATIFSFFSESADVVKTSGSVEYPGSAFTPWISASHKYYRVLCTFFLTDIDVVILKWCGFENRWILV